MSTGFTEWYFQLFNTRTRKPIDDDSGICNVLTDGSPVEISLYTSGNGQTAASNPITFTNGVINFWTADTVTSLDLTIQTASAHAVFAESVTLSDHRIDIDPDRMVQKLVIPYTFSGASEAIVDTGFDIFAAMLIKDIELDVFTAMTGGVLDIGTSTDTDGFLDGIAASTTGFPITALEEAIVSTSALFGAYLANITGTYVRKKHVRANATSGANIVYTNTTSSSTAGNGYVYLTYDRLPSRA
jgi:hypothetical protein